MFSSTDTEAGGGSDTETCGGGSDTCGGGSDTGGRGEQIWQLKASSSNP